MKPNRISLPLIFASVTALLSACGGGSSTTTPKPEDKTAPELLLIDSNPYFLALGASFVDPGATAMDDTDGDITFSVKEINNVDSNQAGCYQQSYSVTDSSGNRAQKSRTIFVGTDTERHSPNTPPVSQEDSEGTIIGQSVSVDVLKNDSDADCDDLRISSFTAPDGGTARVNADGTITFTPPAQVGSYFMLYTITDGYQGFSTSGLTIGVSDPDDGNDAWPNVKDDFKDTRAGQPVTIDVLANDSDGDGDILILDMVDDPAGGSVRKENSKIIYTPDPGFTGQDTFYYGVHDGHGHNGSAKVTVTVKP